ncbi:glycosyltransferase family 4 protein [Sporosarcina luteola]|uniref:glycosyltransferase family 4 protein n=1 Tax=Sporosarcina luteola TaxID=582850 RepID=UPI00203DA848|nr:glycosyltransferase family 4 protein [Sporosarcina luteola]MCM3639278.1 glycosyltransferase family 4 protein [Sporosarcina luteola]
MKVLQITNVSFTVKKFLLPLVDEMIEQKYDVHIACYKDETGYEVEKDGYVVHHIPFQRNMNVFSHFKSMVALVKLIRKERFDIVHSHTPVASLVARVSARLVNVPLSVYTAHGFYFHENMKPIPYKINYWLEKIWAKYFTDKLFFQSKEDYELALAKCFQKPENLIHISNGVSGNRFNPELYSREKSRESLGSNDEKVIIFVGRLVREKGIVELIEAFHLVLNEIKDATLLIVGDSVTGDRDGMNVEQLIQSMPFETKERIQLLGMREDIPELLCAADLFVLPSYREGLPRSIIEAMAMGKPIVATDVRGCREEVFPDVNGYLCKAKDSNSLADTIIEILKDETKLKLFGENSRRLFLEEFNEKVVLERQMKVFNQFREERSLNKRPRK